MRHPRRWAAPLVALVAIALLGACAEDQPLAPEADAPAPAFSVAGVSSLPATGRYLVDVNGQMGPVVELVAELGGEVAIDLSELGALVVSGLDDAAAAQLAADKKVKTLEAEVELQLVPDLADMEWSTEEAPVGAAPAGHDPTTALFFPSQWDMQIIDADDAWNAGFNDASGVRVAILDTGIDPSH